MAPHGSITTFSGVLFWPLLPNPDDIRIADIAHALSQQCRFAGHTRTFYSVAEHSVPACYAVRKTRCGAFSTMLRKPF